MGWRGFMRGYVAIVRQQHRAEMAVIRQRERRVATAQREHREAVVAEQREEREALRQRKKLLAEMHEVEKLGELARAKNDVALYENYVATLVSVHKECWLPWRWEAVAGSAPPPVPFFTPIVEPQARAALAAYVPSLSERLLGDGAFRRLGLVNAIEAARQQDLALYQQAVEAHRHEYGRWEWLRNVSAGVLAGEPNAYAAVIENLSPFDELSDLGSDVSVLVKAPWCLEATLTVRDAEVVPNEIYSLQASGKMSTKKMPQGRYWELYQDHVCSCALRVARELFGLLPIDVALVHVVGHALNKATGHEELQPLLSVGFARATVNRLNLDVLDPSESMRNFSHRMDFKKASGFRPIERLAATEFQPASPRWAAGPLWSAAGNPPR